VTTKRLALLGLGFYAVLSVVDFVFTFALIRLSGGAAYEANPVAAAWLDRFGWPGLAVPVRLTRSAPGAEVRRGEAVGSVTARPGTSAVRVDLRTDGSTAEPGLWWKLTRRP